MARASFPRMDCYESEKTRPSSPKHHYPFDPTHGYTLESLLQVGAPEEPEDYEQFWRDRYAQARVVEPQSELHDTGVIQKDWRVFDWSYHSTGGVKIRGWALLPENGVIRRGMLIGHGYDAPMEPDFDLELEEMALFFPCARGLGRSRMPSISSESKWHVLHDIQSRSRYVLGGCVEDLWLGVSAMLQHFPEIAGHIGYRGISFSGGIGAMAIAWDNRIVRGQLTVPSFGNQPLRLLLASNGSAVSVQQFSKKCPKLHEVLRYYDAAIAARYIRVPMHCDCALFDPAVAPAGQFAIYNAIPSTKSLLVLTAGHHPHPDRKSEEAEVQRNCHNFFRDL